MGMNMQHLGRLVDGDLMATAICTKLKRTSETYCPEQGPLQ
jgi:hypothetical protein